MNRGISRWRGDAAFLLFSMAPILLLVAMALEIREKEGDDRIIRVWQGLSLLATLVASGIALAGPWWTPLSVLGLLAALHLLAFGVGMFLSSLAGWVRPEWLLVTLPVQFVASWILTCVWLGQWRRECPRRRSPDA